MITRTLPVDFQGQWIELRGYMQLQDVTDSAGLWLREDADAAVLSLENMHSQQVKGTREWAGVPHCAPVNPIAQTIHFGVLFSGTGTVPADDLELLVNGMPDCAASDNANSCGPAGGSSVRLGFRCESQQPHADSGFEPGDFERVWGFLKYHHPAITAGQQNWDTDLFRVMPKVLAARDREQANSVLLDSIDTLGPVPTCNPCVPVPAGDVDLKPELAWIHDRGALGAALSERLESIFANRTGMQFFVSAASAGKSLFVHEPAYPGVKFPDSGYQLLALFRWWNIMQYRAPYRATAGQDWNAVLAEFLPRWRWRRTRRRISWCCLSDCEGE